VNPVARCPNCDSENREGSRFCDSCGAKIGAEGAGAKPGLQLAPPHTDGEGASPSETDDGAADSTETDGVGWPESSPDPEGNGDAGEDSPAEPDAADETDGGGATDSSGEPAWAASPMDEGDADAEATDAEVEESEEEPKAGYLVFPDNTEQQIPPSQWLIGRADLAKYLRDPKKANEISRGHLTVFQDDGKFFVEDGKTMVQDKASTNRTWVVRGASRILVTGTGRNELQDADEIDVAELVKLQFVVK